jgi:hypothetical protein
MNENNFRCEDEPLLKLTVTRFGAILLHPVARSVWVRLSTRYGAFFWYVSAMTIAMIFLRILFVFLRGVSDEDARGLYTYASAYSAQMTIDGAREHLVSARIAGAFYDVDPDLLLAIARHESNLESNTVTPEPGHRVSCGVMTPKPMASCSDESLVGQYMDGAHHLMMDWGRVGDVRSRREMLLGFAGGYGLIRGCRRGPVLRHGEYGDDLCRTPEVFYWMRAQIRAARYPVL